MMGDVPSVLPASVELREVGPRDGLQVEEPVPVADRVRLVRALAHAGLRTIEVGAFVSPRAVPAMVGSDEVVAAAKALGGVHVVGLVPNARGAAAAVAAGVDELTCTMSASEAYSASNVKMTIDESLVELGRIRDIAAAADLPVDVVVSCAFGSPYEGEIPTADVVRVVQACRARGVSSLSLADTTGMATPRGVGELLGALGPDVGMHFHETRGTGLVNVYASVLGGVTRFDTSVGGLGGSPFARGAAGNVATEGVVSMLEDLGVRTGVDLPRLLDAARLLEGLVGHELPSPVARSGPRVPAPTA